MFNFEFILLKTYHPKKKHLSHSWLLIDAQDKVLGKLASETAKLCMLDEAIFTILIPMRESIILG